MRISIKKCFLIAYLIIMLLPAHFSNAFIGACNNIFSLLAMIMLFQHKYRPNKFVRIVTYYYLFLLMMTLISGTMTINIAIYNIKYIVFIACIHMLYQMNPSSTLKTLFNVIFLFVFVDLMTILLYPNGLYTTVTEYSQWSSASVANWFFGNKNNRITWELLMICLATICNSCGYIKKTLYCCTVLSCVVAVFMTKSSTSIVAIVIAVIAVILKKYQPQNININWKIFFALYAGIAALVLVGNVGFLSPIIYQLFGKDVTFTGRASTWVTVIKYIKEKPFFGWGIITSDQAIQMISKASAVNAHSQWLQVLLQGGIVGLLIFVAIIFECFKKLNYAKKETQFFLFGLLFSLLLVMIFEVEMGFTVLLILFLCCEYLNISIDSSRLHKGDFAVEYEKSSN